MKDLELHSIVALKAGDISGLESLVRHYQDQAIRVAYQITGNPAIAEDVVADAFLTVYNHINGFDVERPFGPWFLRIVVNAALAAARQEGKVCADGQVGRLLESKIDPGPSSDSRLLRREVQDAVIEALSVLRSKQRAVVVLRYYLDLEVQEVADTLGIPTGTVKWRLHAAKKQLKHQLQSDSREARYLNFWEGETK